MAATRVCFHARTRHPEGDSLRAMSNTIIPEVERLIHVCRDGEELFRQAANLAVRPQLKSLLQEYAAQRRTFLSELQNEAVAFGESEPSESGTLTGALRRGWAMLRDTVCSSDEQKILSDCEKGEDAALEAYRIALQSKTLPDQLRDLLARQYAEITSAHQHIRDRRDSDRAGV